MSSDVKIHIIEHEVKNLAGHENERDHLLKMLNNDDYDPSNPNQLLGVDWNNRVHTEIKAKYYIGLAWINDGESALYVEPKVPNLDFISMFMHCFDNEHQDIISKLEMIYNIDFNKKQIKISSVNTILTPMLIVHFLKLTEGIVKKGLKSNYLQREENLKSKVKGKIRISKTIARNHCNGRTDRVVCSYQDYSIDCIENRILKKALLFVNRFLETHNGVSKYEELKQITTYCLGAMSSIGEDISFQQLRNFRVNPLYKGYAEALKVAKLILKRFAYSIETVDQDSENRLPPFWIDMSLLFELYVYSQLRKAYGNEIEHQVRTYGNEVDFVKYDEKIIIDAKYIPKWDDSVNHDNVRQLSGYARNSALRHKIMKTKKDELDETTILNCAIVYPNKNASEVFDDKGIINEVTKIDRYIKFHKIPIKLPVL